MSSSIKNKPSVDVRVLRLIGMLCIGSSLVVGCGQKGDLYLPAGSASSESKQMIESGSSPQDDAFDRVDDEPMTDLPSASSDPNDY